MSELQFMFWATLRAVDAGLEKPVFSWGENGDLIAKSGRATLRAHFVNGLSREATASTPGFFHREFNLEEYLAAALAVGAK